MFHSEPEGCYRCTESVVIAPFWFLTDEIVFVNSNMEKVLNVHYSKRGLRLHHVFFLERVKGPPSLSQERIHGVLKTAILSRIHVSSVLTMKTFKDYVQC